jgi:hypothetical protein
MIKIKKIKNKDSFLKEIMIKTIIVRHESFSTTTKKKRKKHK